MQGTLPKGMAVVVVVLLVMFLTKVANNTRTTDNQGATFWLNRQKVVECTAEEITLEDQRGSQIHLIKDASWPSCTEFHREEMLDFQLSRGERTHYVKYQPSGWWR